MVVGMKRNRKEIGIVPQSLCNVYIHFVWATKERHSLISPQIEPQLYEIIAAEVHASGCRLLAIGGMPDHVHLFCKMVTAISIAELMNKVKGVSSRVANQNLFDDKSFAWQNGFGAFSVGEPDVRSTINYIHNQKKHHRENSLFSDWEQFRDVTCKSPNFDRTIS